MTRAMHQLVHTLSYGDAISSEVLALQRCFVNLGYASEIYALNVHPKYKERAQSVASFPERFSGGLILHYSLGSPLNDLYRRQTQAHRTLIFHNLTPSRYFAGINPRIVHDIEKGQEELPPLCALSDRLVADSAFNAKELAELGFKAEVLELTVDPDRWSEPANPGIGELLRSSGEIHLLHVGRIAPNKCIEDLIKIFYFVHKFGDKKSRLWLPGIDTDTELYSFSLKRLARALGVEDAVVFPGCMADSEIRALYENATVYLCMSEHEGFCLPVAEAMRFGLPVVAYASTALPETVGGGGVLVSEKRHAEIAELVLHIARTSELRQRLREAGFQRIKELGYERFVARVGQVFTEAPARASAQSQESPSQYNVANGNLRG